MLDQYVSELAKSNVLLLGISYPCVRSQMQRQGLDPAVLNYQEPSVEQAVECVRRNILTEMDARDLARCVAVEQATNTRVYTVSREIGAVYNDRHINCDFNTRNFCKKITDQFGERIQFTQVILDYYWMPTGWLVTRWAKTLFQQTLPDLVRHQMLTFPSKRKKARKHGAGPPYDIDEGVVFLPFCAHVCKELVGAVHILENYYEISFLDKKDLHGHSLWKGTMEIDPNVMQHRLGKRLDQEEIYCKFRPKDIYESMEDPHISKPAVMRILLAIKNYDDVRMVRLRPLRQHEQASVFRERMWAPEVGGFMGLDFDLSARLLKEQKSRKGNSQLAIEEEKKEEDMVLVELKQKVKLKKHKKSGSAKFDIAHASDHEEEEVVADTRCQFYPGPVQDLETYTETKKVIAQDLKVLAAFRVKQKLKKEKELRAAKARKGIIRLPGDESMKTNATSEVKLREYLLFNPRVPGGGPNHGDAEKEWELDWSVIREKELKLFLDNAKESDDESSVVDVEVDPFLADDLDLKAASIFYHGLVKGFSSPNKCVDGLERVARVQVYDEIVEEETVCFAVDETSEREPKYKEFVVADVDSPVCEVYGEVCTLLSNFIERRWERVLFTEDMDWISEKTSEWPIKTVPITGIDGAEYHIRIDRRKNLRLVVHWLLCGQETDEEFSDCFRSIVHQLFAEIPSLADMATSYIAIEIEERLLKHVLAITDQWRQNPISNPEGTLPGVVLHMILCRLPGLSADEAASTMLSLQYVHGQPRFPTVVTITDDLSDALDLIELHTRIDNSVLVWESERNMVPDLLFVTLQQFTPCMLTEADRVRLGARARLGGMSCRHCWAGSACYGQGHFFPNPHRPLSQQDALWRSIIFHIVSCDWCPTVIKTDINARLEEHVNAEGKLVLRNVLGTAGQFLETVQRRLANVSRVLPIDTKASPSTSSLPCQGLAIEVVRHKSRKKPGRTIGSMRTSPRVSLAATIPNDDEARNQVISRIKEESQSDNRQPCRENVLEPIDDSDSQGLIPASVPKGTPSRRYSIDRLNSNVSSVDSILMDSLSKLSEAPSTPYNDVVRNDRNTGAHWRRNPGQTADTTSVLEVLPKLALERETATPIPTHEGGSNRKRRRSIRNFASNVEANTSGVSSKSIGPGGENMVKEVTPVLEILLELRNKKTRRAKDTSGGRLADSPPLCRSSQPTSTEPLAAGASANVPTRLTGNTRQGSDITWALRGSRQKGPFKGRDLTELPQLAAHSATPPSTKQEVPGTASRKSESPRKLRKIISRHQHEPTGSPSTNSSPLVYDSLVRIASPVLSDSLYNRFPDVFALSRLDPANEACSQF